MHVLYELENMCTCSCFVTSSLSVGLQRTKCSIPRWSRQLEQTPKVPQHNIWHLLFTDENYYSNKKITVTVICFLFSHFNDTLRYQKNARWARKNKRKLITVVHRHDFPHLVAKQVIQRRIPNAYMSLWTKR